MQVFKAMGKIPMMKMTLTVPEKVFVDEEVEIGVHIRRLHAKVRVCLLRAFHSLTCIV